MPDRVKGKVAIVTGAGSADPFVENKIAVMFEGERKKVDEYIRRMRV